MRVHLGSDHAGLELKDHLMTWLVDHGYEPVDHGPFVYDALDDYPCFCLRAAEGVAGDRAEGLEQHGNSPLHAAGKRQRMLSALIAEMGTDAPAQVLPILCFANCERGCSAGISAAGKWSYLMGDLAPEHAADLLAYAETYAKAKTGVVLPSKRPPSLEKTVIARFPASHAEFKDAAE